MYQRWKQVRDSDPAGACTELSGFTRLVASRGGKPDGLEGEVPSVFVAEYDPGQIARFHGYRVINRPYSVAQFVTNGGLDAIKEEYLYVAETDHILLQPIPNSATKGSPMGYVFNYMGPNPAHAKIIEDTWPAGGAQGYKVIDPVGPSPIVIHRDDLKAVAKPWSDMSVSLKTNPTADSKLGWVIEMWGYAIAAASVGLKHKLFRDFQVEPGSLSGEGQLRDFTTRYWIFHYTYQFELMLDGEPCQPWTIGEFSLDKRHFSDVYPPHPLPEPPKQANVAAFYLIKTFNDAMAAIADWPRRQPPAGSLQPPLPSVYGRRRLDWFSRHANGFATELRTMPLVKALAGTAWKCTGSMPFSATLSLTDAGDATISTRRGRWGTMNDPTLEEACPVYACIFVDAGGAAYNARVDGGAASPTRLVIFTIPSGSFRGRELAQCARSR